MLSSDFCRISDSCSTALDSNSLSHTRSAKTKQTKKKTKMKTRNAMIGIIKKVKFYKQNKTKYI